MFMTVDLLGITLWRLRYGITWQRTKEPGCDCYYLGHHKCATNWMRTFLKQVSEMVSYNYIVIGGSQDRNVKLHRRQHTFYLHVNSFPSTLSCIPENARGFHLIRDPRDAFVSDYFSRRNSHKIHNAEQRELREYLLCHSLEDGLTHMLDHCAYLQQIEDWRLNSRSNVLEVRYEDCLRDTGKEFKGILDHLGIVMPERILAVVVKACSFRRMSGGRDCGEENPNAHLRKGVAGDWKQYLPVGSRIHDAFMKRYGHILDNLGYSVKEN